VSADNGHIIRQNDAGKFVLQNYWASGDAYPEILQGTEGPQIFDTLEAAVLEYSGDNGWEGKYYDEYGLTVDVKKPVVIPNPLPTPIRIPAISEETSYSEV
jgi:hypothetical protein